MMGMAPLSSRMQLTSKHTPSSDKKRIETTEALALGQKEIKALSRHDQGWTKKGTSQNRKRLRTMPRAWMCSTCLVLFSFSFVLSHTHPPSLSLYLCCSFTMQQGILGHIGNRGANSCFCRPGVGGLAGVGWGWVGNGIMKMQRELATKEAFDYPNKKEYKDLFCRWGNWNTWNNTN